MFFQWEREMCGAAILSFLPSSPPSCEYITLSGLFLHHDYIAFVSDDSKFFLVLYYYGGKS